MQHFGKNTLIAFLIVCRNARNGYLIFAMSVMTTVYYILLNLLLPFSPNFHIVTSHTHSRKKTQNIEELSVLAISTTFVN